MSDKRASLYALQLIAAKAAKLAYDLEHNRLYSDDLQRGAIEIRSVLSDVEAYARSIEAGDR